MKKLLVVLVALFFVATAVGSFSAAYADGVGQFRPTTNYPYVGGYEADQNYFVPTFNHYAFSVTDSYAPTRAEIDEMLGAVQNATRRCIIPVNDYRDVQFNSPCIQIINNVVWGSYLITAILPSNFSPEPNKYPAVISPNFGGASNNFVLYGLRINGKPYSALNLARLADAGAIVVMSNVGGSAALGYQTVYPYEMAALFDTLSAYWGVNKYRLIGFGGSRGAIVSLTLAENRLGLDYQYGDLFISGLVGLRIGEQLESDKVSNFPNVGDIINSFAGDPQAFRNESRKLDVLYGIFGTRDFDYADAVGVFANAWRLLGVNIHSSIGTEDSYMGIWEMIAFEKELLRLGIPARIDYVVGAGHSSVVDREINKALPKCVRHWPGSCSTPKDARFVYRVELGEEQEESDSDHYGEEQEQDSGSQVKFQMRQAHDAPLPFISTVMPYRLAPAESGEVVMVGPAGASFFVANSVGLSVSDSFDDTEKVSVPFFAGDRDIAWQFQFVTPDGKTHYGPVLVTSVGPISSVEDYKIPGRSDITFGFSLPLLKK